MILLACVVFLDLRDLACVLLNQPDRIIFRENSRVAFSRNSGFVEDLVQIVASYAEQNYWLLHVPILSSKTLSGPESVCFFFVEFFHRIEQVK